MKLNLLPSFNGIPAREIELADEAILCNGVTLPWDFNPHKVRLWAIGHEFGPVAAVWADNEQDALDELIDSGLGDCFLIPADRITPEDEENGTRLGNAGELCNLERAWLQKVRLDPAQDCELLCKFAEARGMGAKHLYF